MSSASTPTTRCAGRRASGSITCSKRPASVSRTNDAVVTERHVLSYRDLNRRANQVARHLIEQGIQSGDRVGLLFDKSPETYVAMLAVMKVNAAYVPLDAAFPIERIRFILGDAEISAIVSMSGFAERLSALRGRARSSSTPRRPRDRRAGGRPADRRRAADRAALLHHLHLGHDRQSEGRRHRARQHLQFRARRRRALRLSPGDRVYQGMTIAFDFSIEEIWVPLMAGATLVPARPGRP